MESTIPVEPGELTAFRESEVPAQLESRTATSEASFELEASPFDIEVPISELGFVHIGISQGQLQQRVEVLRGDLLRMVSAIGAVTLALLSAASLAVWLLYRRGRRLEEQAAEA